MNQERQMASLQKIGVARCLRLCVSTMGGNRQGQKGSDGNGLHNRFGWGGSGMRKGGWESQG